MAPKSRRSFGCIGAILFFGAALVLIPILEVLYVRFCNPPVTTLMIVRRVEAMVTKRYRGDINYRWIPLKQVPDDFLDGVWQMEDSRFFSHEGFDWIEMEEAIQRAKRRDQPVRMTVLSLGKMRPRKPSVWGAQASATAGEKFFHWVLYEWTFAVKFGFCTPPRLPA